MANRMDVSVWRAFGLIVFLLVTLCGLSACGDRVEGCLDIKAENFNASADVDCCCDYPDLLMNVQHVFDTLSFRLDSSYFYDGADTFSVKEIYLLLSEIHPLLNSEAYPLEDTLQIGVNDVLGEERLVIEDNFAAIKPTAFTYPLGTFSQPNTYEGLSIRAGVSETVNRIVPDSVYVSNHPLSNSPDSLWAATDAYFVMYLRIVPNVSNPDIEREIVMLSSEYSQEFSIFGILNATLGYDSNINIKIDYKSLFNGINFAADNDNIISAKLSDNIPFSIQIID